MGKIIWERLWESAPRLKITSVSVKREPDAVTVIIQGRGVFKYQIIPLDAFQLVLDFADAISLLRFQTLPVGHTILYQIHIGQRQKKLRLVFQLAQPAIHTIKKGREGLVVRFT